MGGLDVNGYSQTFKTFIDFASTHDEAAVARGTVEESGKLSARTITATKSDKAYALIRSNSEKLANDGIRTLFRNAIIDMFGGEEKIPKSVLDAMKLQDYGKGRPLTARRILAVKNAIDMSGVTKQMAFAESISKFSGKDMETAALAKGYSKGELPKLASAVNLYAQAKGCSESEALDAVAAPGSKANRLMNYGGRFMQSVDNFRNGLRLMDAFDTWFDNTQASLATIHKGFQKNYTDGLSMTLYNAIEAGFNPDYKRGMEMFAFEELAYNPSISLAETDINKVFGMEHNPATSCIGRDYSEGRAQTLAQIPPEKPV